MFTGPSTEEKEKIIYSRVSSAHQKEDLERQVRDLTDAYPGHRIIRDIGSGLNFNRKGLQTLLELIINRRVQQIVVAHKDRLCRFGFDLFDFLCRSFEVRLVVHYREETSSEQELSEDLLAIINFFVAKNNGRRAGQHRKRRREQHGDHEHPVEAQQASVQTTETMVRSLPVDV